MTTYETTAIRPRFLPRLVSAELLRLRRKRSLFWTTAALMLVPVVLGFTITAILHVTNPDRHGPAGGPQNFNDAIGLLAQIGLVATILVGVTAGTGDLSSGVFRELVITGRSRLSLYAARVPGGVTFLVPFVVMGFVFASSAAALLAGDLGRPDATLVLEQAGWLALALGYAFGLALGLSSLIGSRGLSIGLLLGWQLAVGPILTQTHKIDWLLPNAALQRLQPGSSTPR